MPSAAAFFAAPLCLLAAAAAHTLDLVPVGQRFYARQGVAGAFAEAFSDFPSDPPHAQDRRGLARAKRYPSAVVYNGYTAGSVEGTRYDVYWRPAANANELTSLFETCEAFCGQRYCDSNRTNSPDARVVMHRAPYYSWEQWDVPPEEDPIIATRDFGLGFFDQTPSPDGPSVITTNVDCALLKVVNAPWFSRPVLLLDTNRVPFGVMVDTSSLEDYYGGDTVVVVANTVADMVVYFCTAAVPQGDSIFADYIDPYVVEGGWGSFGLVFAALADLGRAQGDTMRVFASETDACTSELAGGDVVLQDPKFDNATHVVAMALGRDSEGVFSLEATVLVPNEVPTLYPTAVPTVVPEVSAGRRAVSLVALGAALAWGLR